MREKVIFLALAITLTAVPCHAQVSCHCFTDRSFDPKQPASADPYILATTRNGLLAAAAGVGKGELVKMRMTGSGENDLWFSLYLGRLTGAPAGELSGARAKAASWADALDGTPRSTDSLGPSFTEARKARDDEGMARALADIALVRGFGVTEGVVAKLRKQGAGNAEAALSLLLARRDGKDPLTVLAEVGPGKKSWGTLLNEAGIAPEAVADAIAVAFRDGSKRDL